jgi:hypothetical protein
MRGQAEDDTPLGKAQAILYRAFEEPDEQRRVQLAKDALALCPDCADAYVLLAEHAPSRKEAADRQYIVYLLPTAHRSGYVVQHRQHIV